MTDLENLDQHIEHSARYRLVTLAILLVAVGIPMVIAWVLALLMPTWLAPPDTNIWMTLNLYVVVGELLWIIPLILVIRRRKINVRKFRARYKAMFAGFVIFWGFFILLSFNEDNLVFIYSMSDETTICERHVSGNSVSYECYGYFSDPMSPPNQNYDWRFTVKGSSMLPIVRAPCNSIKCFCLGC